jgi:hypothetical protein
MYDFYFYFDFDLDFVFDFDPDFDFDLDFVFLPTFATKTNVFDTLESTNTICLIPSAASVEVIALPHS